MSLRQGGLILVFGNELEIQGYSVLKECHLLAEVILWWLRRPVLGAHRPGFELQFGCWPAAGPWVNSGVLVCWVGQLLQSFLTAEKPSVWTLLEEANGTQP